MSVLYVPLEIVLALESISGKLTPGVWTQVGSLKAMLRLTMPDEVFFEGKAPIAPQLFAVVRPYMRPRMSL